MTLDVADRIPQVSYIISPVTLIEEKLVLVEEWKKYMI